MTNTLRKVGSNLLKVGSALNIWDGTGDPCCCGFSCLGCATGTVPPTMQIEIPATWVTQSHGWTPDCDDPECDLLEGPFVLDFVDRVDNVCEWTYNDGSLSDCLTTMGLLLRVNKISSISYSITLALTGQYFADRPPINGGPGLRTYFFSWALTGLTVVQVCDEFADLEIPFVSGGFQIAGGLEEGCQYGGEAALLTSL